MADPRTLRAEINARARGGLTALMLAVINDRPEAVRLLLERGVDVNAQTGAGWTALTFAVWKDEAELVRALLSHGAKPNVIDKQVWRPLDYAAPKLAPTDADLARNPAEPRWILRPSSSTRISGVLRSATNGAWCSGCCRSAAADPTRTWVRIPAGLKCEVRR